MDLLPSLPTNGLILLVAPRKLIRHLTTTLTVQLALTTAVNLLDGGNRFDGLKLTRELRRHTRGYHTALSRVTVARAFTCYQMETLLADTPPGPTPALVMEILTTFYDENIALPADDPLFAALQQAAQHHWTFELPATVSGKISPSPSIPPVPPISSMQCGNLSVGWICDI